jgi:hypothetical protein
LDAAPWKPFEKDVAKLTIRRIRMLKAVMAQSVRRKGCGMDDRGSRFRFQAGAGNVSLHHRV